MLARSPALPLQRRVRCVTTGPTWPPGACRSLPHFWPVHIHTLDLTWARTNQRSMRSSVRRAECTEGDCTLASCAGPTMDKPRLGTRFNELASSLCNAFGLLLKSRSASHRPTRRANDYNALETQDPVSYLSVQLAHRIMTVF